MKRVSHGVGTPNKLNLDRKAEKMVEDVRLKNIEREHRSIGAMIDHRTLIPLVAPKLRQYSINKMELENRQATRRDAAGTSIEVLESSQNAMKNMIQKGIEIKAVDNYENEELIWATKTRDPNYAQKRKYYHKDLQEFKDNMTSEQKVAFKMQTHEKLVEIVTKYREEMGLMKEEMDLAGIFHPDANAHRAHCMYLMKLYKGIRSDTIEDPILRKLRSEEAAKKRAMEEEERKQRELIESIENKTKGIKTQKPVPAASVEATTAISAFTSETPKSTAQPLERSSKKMSAAETRKSISAKIVPSKPSLNRSKSLPVMKSAPSASSKLSISALEKTVEMDEENLSPRPADDVELHNAGADSKLFTKIKRGKMGGIDSKTLLLEEAARLEKGEILDVKKVRERSSLVDNEMTCWMLGLLQSNQIEKTAQGREVVPSTIDLFSSSQTMDQDLASDYSPDKASALRNDVLNSKRMVPFGEFYDMFRAYSAETRERKEKERENEKRRLDKEAKRLNKYHYDHHDHHEDHSPSPRDIGDSGYGISPELNAHNHLEKVAKNSDEAPPKRIDLVGELRETDPQFDEYYRMTLRQKPQGARLFKGAITKIPKLRAIAPLGKNAVTIIDTRGNEKAISSKGFFNIFTTRNASDDTTKDNSTIHSYAASVTDDDEKSVDDNKEEVLPPQTPTFPGASPPGTQGTQRSPSPSNSRRSRNRSRGKKPGILHDSDKLDGPDFQTKLVCVWDCLQMPALNRLTFMRKYASKAFAAELTRATDMWGEVAVLVLAKVNLVDRNVTKVREGYAVLPLSAANLLVSFYEAVPPALSSKAASVCFQAGENCPLSIPMSVLVIDRVKRIVENTIPSSSESSMNEQEALRLLEMIGSKIVELLLNSISQIEDELADSVSFSGVPVKTWLESSQ